MATVAHVTGDGLDTRVPVTLTVLPFALPSMRLKHVRDGLEDHGWLTELANRGRGEEARTIARALFPAPYDTLRTDEELQSARGELARLLARGAPPE